jgi:hypothetical protein
MPRDVRLSRLTRAAATAAVLSAVAASLFCFVASPALAGVPGRLLPSVADHPAAVQEPRLAWSITLHNTLVGVASMITSNDTVTLSGSAPLEPGATGALAYKAISVDESADDQPASPAGGFSSAQGHCGQSPPDPNGKCNTSDSLVSTQPGALKIVWQSSGPDGSNPEIELAFAQLPSETVRPSCSGDCGKFPNTTQDYIAWNDLHIAYDQDGNRYFRVSGFKAGSGGNLVASQTFTQTEFPTKVRVKATFTYPGLVAKIAPATSVTRGSSYFFDGSPSTGGPERWNWAVQAGRDCPAGAVNEKWAQETSQPRAGPFTLLCSITVTLTVSRGSEKSAPATRRIKVSARKGKNWNIPPAEYNFDATGKDPRSPTDKNTVGLNVNGCPDGGTAPADDPNVFCPYTGRGYDVAKVLTGPFADDWYITSSTLTIKRLGLFNRLYGPDGEVEPGARVNFYTYNVAEKGNAANVAGLVAAVRKHEKAHTDAMQAGARRPEGNASALIEPLIAKDSDGLFEKADPKIRSAAKFVYGYSTDNSGHLAHVDWSGALYFWETTIPDHGTGKVFKYNKWVPEHCHYEKDNLSCSTPLPTDVPPDILNPTKR